MSNEPLPPADLRWLGADAATGAPITVVDLDAEAAVGSPKVPLGVPVVVVGLAAGGQLHEHPAAGCCDVVLHRDDTAALEAVRSTVNENPVASVALALVLRGADARSIDDGLLLESATYSTLQAGPEFARWRVSRPPRPRRDEGAPVRLVREGDVLDIALNRPEVRNALNSEMRDELVQAFWLVALDDSIKQVHFRGDGPAFCAGGDLDEFGSLPDPATAHLVRLQQSVGHRIAEVADRVTAHLHGACFGSGIELPAFAGRVVATPDTTFALPEIALGLIPGAGGTVSLPARIGRHRTARLALTGERLDASTALSWGLVDDIAR